MQCALQFYPKYLLNFVSLTYKKSLFIQDLLSSKLKDYFNTDWKTVFGHDKNMPLISSCMMPPIDDARYESIESYKELRESLEENLRELKTQPGTFGMDLVSWMSCNVTPFLFFFLFQSNIC